MLGLRTYRPSSRPKAKLKGIWKINVIIFGFELATVPLTSQPILFNINNEKFLEFNGLIL